MRASSANRRWNSGAATSDPPPGAGRPRTRRTGRPAGQRAGGTWRASRRTIRRLRHGRREPTRQSCPASSAHAAPDEVSARAQSSTVRKKPGRDTRRPGTPRSVRAAGAITSRLSRPAPTTALPGICGRRWRAVHRFLTASPSRIDVGELTVSAHDGRIEQCLVPQRDRVGPELVPAAAQNLRSVREGPAGGGPPLPYAGLQSTRRKPFSVTGQVAQPLGRLPANQSCAGSCGRGGSKRRRAG